jgi:hypothetical protein
MAESWLTINVADMVAGGPSVIRLGRTLADLEAASPASELGGHEYHVNSVFLRSDSVLELSSRKPYHNTRTDDRWHSFKQVRKTTLAAMTRARVYYPGRVASSGSASAGTTVWVALSHTLEFKLSDPEEDPERQAFLWRAELVGHRVDDCKGQEERWLR